MCRQAAALHQLHAEVILPVELTDLVEGNDVGVFEVRGGFGFGAETLSLGLAGEFAGANPLQGHDPVQLELTGAIDHAHAAAGDHFKQLVAREGAFTTAAGGLRRQIILVCGRFEEVLQQTVRAKPERCRGRQGTPALRAVFDCGHGFHHAVTVRRHSLPTGFERAWCKNISSIAQREEQVPDLILDFLRRGHGV